LLWAYQKTFFGEITVEKNRTLPDADLRERSLLWVMAAMILFMGIGSTVFTTRTENSVRAVLEQMQPPPMAAPVNAKVVEDNECPALTPTEIKKNAEAAR
jgi:NADH:ubiquinone oxidoreductase subunit 4 (subunit M)